MAADRSDLLPEQEAELVDGVRGEVTDHPGSCGLATQAPRHRGLGVSEPVLEVADAGVPDHADTPLGDQPLGERQRWNASVVEAHRREHPGGGDLGGRRHRFRLGHRVRERLLDQHVLAGLQRRHGHLGMQVPGSADVDDVDVIALERGAPVRDDLVPAVLTGGGRRPLLVAAHQHAPGDRRHIGVEGVDVAPGVGVGLPHEGVAHECDTEGRRG